MRLRWLAVAGQTVALVVVAGILEYPLPLGWCLAHPLKFGVTGMWWGITAGLTITALYLVQRFLAKTR